MGVIHVARDQVGVHHDGAGIGQGDHEGVHVDPATVHGAMGQAGHHRVAGATFGVVGENLVAVGIPCHVEAGTYPVAGESPFLFSGEKILDGAETYPDVGVHLSILHGVVIVSGVSHDDPANPVFLRAVRISGVSPYPGGVVIVAYHRGIAVHGPNHVDRAIHVAGANPVDPFPLATVPGVGSRLVRGILGADRTARAISADSPFRVLARVAPSSLPPGVLTPFRVRPRVPSPP